jgi:hypothetical protein
VIVLLLPLLLLFLLLVLLWTVIVQHATGTPFLCDPVNAHSQHCPTTTTTTTTTTTNGNTANTVGLADQLCTQCGRDGVDVVSGTARNGDLLRERGARSTDGRGVRHRSTGRGLDLDVKLRVLGLRKGA